VTRLLAAVSAPAVTHQQICTSKNTNGTTRFKLHSRTGWQTPYVPLNKAMLSLNVMQMHVLTPSPTLAVKMLDDWLPADIQLQRNAQMQDAVTAQYSLMLSSAVSLQHAN